MVSVYALRLDEELSEARYHYLIHNTSREKRNKIQSYARKEDALRGLFSDLLIRYLIIQNTGLKKEAVFFDYSAYGKPSVNGLDNFHFNISHSREWIVCATDEHPVGIDIEHIVSIDLNLFEQSFSGDEYRYLSERQPGDQLSCFYELWTLKESYIKQRGEGLSIPMDAFAISTDNGKEWYLKNAPGERASVSLKQYNIDKDYKMAVCAQSGSFREIVHISLQQIIYFFEQKPLV